MPDSDNGNTAGNWREYKRLVLAELERMNTNIEALRKGQARLYTEVTMLKVKSGLWGAAAGAIPAALAILWWLFKGGG